MIMEKFSVVGANKTPSGGIFTRSSEPTLAIVSPHYHLLPHQRDYCDKSDCCEEEMEEEKTTQCYTSNFLIVKPLLLSEEDEGSGNFSMLNNIPFPVEHALLTGMFSTTLLKPRL